MKLLNLLKKYLLLLFFLIATQFLVAQVKTLNNGLITINISTPHGNIYTYLPENFVVNMPISGSFFLEPNGSSAKDIQKNRKKLLEYSLKLGDFKLKLKDMVFSTIMKTDQINMSILDGKGKLIKSTNTHLTSKIQPETFSFPEGIKSADRSQIIGAFDGNLKNNSILINGQNSTILAQSPVQTLFKAPKLATGVHKISVKKNNNEIANGKTQIVNYELTAGKLKLKKGQTSFILATITGLNFLEKPIPLTVENMTPTVITLEGGNSQKIMISKQSGAFTKRWSIRSIKTGDFIISTNLQLPDTKFPKEQIIIATNADNENDENPCKEIKINCDELLVVLNDKITQFDKALIDYDNDQTDADNLNKEAKKLENIASNAERDAEPAEEGATITYEGYTYKLADSKLLKVLRDDAYQDYKNGKTDVDKYQERLKDLEGKDAIKEVEKNRKKLEKKLDEIAKEARKKADEAKKTYKKAKEKSETSKKISDQLELEVGAAQKAYDDCLDAAKAEKEKCDKYLAEQSKKEKERLAKLPLEPTYLKIFADKNKDGNYICEEGKIRWKTMGASTSFEWKLPESPVFEIKSNIDYGHYKVPGSENFLGQLSELFSAFDLATSNNKKRALGELTVSKTSEYVDNDNVGFPIVTSPMGYASAITKIGDRAVKAVDKWMKEVDSKGQYLEVKVEIKKVIVKCAPIEVCRNGNWIDDGFMSLGRASKSKLNTINYTSHLNRDKDLKGQMRLIMTWYKRKSKVWSDFELDPCRKNNNQ